VVVADEGYLFDELRNQADTEAEINVALVVKGDYSTVTAFVRPSGLG
jgi:hypothetical protein